MKNKTVIIVIRGGVAYVNTRPDDIIVEIHDYDVQEENTRTHRDEDGDLYEKGVYKS